MNLQRRITNSDIASAGSLNTVINTVTVLLAKKYLDCNHVRIYPAVVVMKNAFEMKEFREKIVIKNCGHKIANVRIFNPNSNYFKIMTIPGGVDLAPGMKIVRYITHKFNAQTSLTAVNFPIFINEKLITYHVVVTIPQANVVADCENIDFGIIDIGDGCHHTLKLHNTGTSQGFFTVDVVPDQEFQINVLPKRGIIDVMEVIELQVELKATKTGEYIKEFWIKTNPLIRIQIHVTIIIPVVKPLHPLTNYDITIIDFPKTYYGSSCLKVLVLQNISSTPSMFCSMAEMDNETLELENAKSRDCNYQFFHIDSPEGRLQSFASTIMQFSFRPFKTTYFKKKHAFGFIKIMKVMFRDYMDKDAITYEERPSSLFKESSIEILISDMDAQNDKEESPTYPYPDFFRVCFHGEIEEVLVKIRPETIHLRGMIGERYEHEIYIKNENKFLPIWFKYEPVPFINLEPKFGKLQSEEAKEILMIIKPQQLGECKLKVKFNLLYPRQPLRKEVDVIGQVSIMVSITGSMVKPIKKNKYVQGITPLATNEVGYIVTPVTFEMKNELPMKTIVSKKQAKANRNDLVSVPNDRPQGFRPWRNPQRCATLFANIPRHISPDDEYNFTPAEFDARTYNQSYYLKLISNSYTKRQKVLNRINAKSKKIGDYDLTFTKHILLEKMKCLKGCGKSPVNKMISHSVPLPPTFLNKIIINPNKINLGKMTIDSKKTAFFEIENLNTFTVFICLTPTKKCVTLQEKHFSLYKNSKIKCMFTLAAKGVNNVNAGISVLVNSCHIGDVDVTATIITPSLNCYLNEIIMSPADTIKFVTLINRIDTPLPFRWHLSDDHNYIVYPRIGYVPPKKLLTSAIIFRPKINSIDNIELTVSSMFREHTISVHHQPRKVQIQFDKEILDFGNIPSNKLTIKKLYMRNWEENSVNFIIDNPTPVFGLQAKPKDGFIRGNSTRIIYVSAKFRTPIKFVKTLNFTIEQTHKYSITITGIVVYPDVIIRPLKIHTHKLVPQAKTYYSFSLENLSVVDAHVKFSMEGLKEFSIQNLFHEYIKELTLLGGEKQQLILEFSPTEAVAYGVYLPIQLNNLFGPPKLNVARSLVPENYLPAQESDEGITKIPIPATLPIMVLNCAAGTHLIEFSNLKIKFNKNKNKIMEEFTMTNMSDKNIKLIIDFSSLSTSFQIKYISGATITNFEKTSLIKFGPNDVAIHEILFTETTFGIYENKLPIYIKEYFDNCLFNYLTLKGVYERPLMKQDKGFIYFENLLPGEESEKITCDFVLKYHKGNCNISYKPELEFLKISNEDDDSTESDIATFAFVFCPKEDYELDTKIIFNCTCGAEAEVIVRGVAENCVATAYLRYANKVIDDDSILNDKLRYSTDLYTASKASFSSFINNDFGKFPYFPTADSTNLSLSIKLRILTVVENWLFEQGFFCKQFYKLPFGIPHFSMHEKIENNNVQLPIQEFLYNICGSQFMNQISINLQFDENDPVGSTIYCYTFYKNLLIVLKTFGMYGPHIQAQVLLTYEQYIIFKKKLIDADADDLTGMIPHESFFYSLAAQAWMDLILQIYKIFVLSKVTQNVESIGDDFIEYSKNKKSLSKNNSKEEAILVLWLEYIYTNNHLRIFPESPKKTISYIGQDLTDGLILAVILCFYCPYATNDLSGIICKNLENMEVVFNNACLILQTFKTLKLCFYLDPLDIVFPTALEMVMLVNYLFIVLPSMSPQSTITLGARLGNSNKQELTVRNSSPYNICYEILLIQDESMFSISPESIIIQPNSTRKVTVTYTARKVFSTKATLVLCGDTPKYKFAESMAYSLLGVPNVDFSNPIIQTVKLYQPTTIKIPIISPYKNYTCNIYTKTDIDSANEDGYISWEDWAALKIPRQFYSNETTCVFDDEGNSVLVLNICVIVPGTKKIVIYFLHEIGDIFVCLKLKVKVEKSLVETITVNVPFTLIHTTCVCSNQEIKDACARTISLSIPCKNSLLWDGLSVLLRTSRPTETEFWNKYLNIPLGIKILKMMMSSSIFWKFENFDQIFGENITYFVSSSRRVKTQEHVVIADVKDDDSININLHWNPHQVPDEEFITFKAIHDKEVRYYRILFFDNKRRISDIRI